MGTISLSIPTVGQPNSTEDPKIATDLTTIETLVNGNIDSTNLSASAAIAGTQLSASAAIAGTQLSSSAAIAQSQLAIGSWSSLSLGTNIGAQSGAYTPSARLYGDTVRLKGALLTSGTIGTGNTVVTLPSSTMFPTATLFIALRTSGSGTPVAQFEVNTSGQVQLLQAATLGSGIIIGLDGLTFTIS